MNPLVSIIIPIYNSDLYLKETIESAIGQTWPYKEIILINDGSTDKSLAIAKRYECDWIKVYSQSNQGASVARNYGLSKAKGDYIQFLDADDLLSKDKIEKQLALINGLDDMISFCDTIKFKTKKEFGDVIELDVKQITNPFELLLNLYGGFDNPSMITVHSWLTHKNLIEKAGLWNPLLTMDDDGEFFCRVVLQATRVKFCEGTFVYYRKHKNDSLSSQTSSKHYESELLSIKLKTVQILNIKDHYNARKAMGFWFLRLAILSYPKNKRITKLALYELRLLNISPDIPIIGGKIIEIIKKTLGWKFARRVQVLFRKYNK